MLLWAVRRPEWQCFTLWNLQHSSKFPLPSRYALDLDYTKDMGSARHRKILAVSAFVPTLLLI